MEAQPVTGTAETVTADGRRALHVREAVTFDTVPALDRRRASLAGAAGLDVHLAEAGAVDSSALAWLLALRRDTEAAGGRFTVHGVPQALRTLADLYGVTFLVDNAQPPA